MLDLRLSAPSASNHPKQSAVAGSETSPQLCNLLLKLSRLRRDPASPVRSLAQEGALPTARRAYLQGAGHTPSPTDKLVFLECLSVPLLGTGVSVFTSTSSGSADTV